MHNPAYIVGKFHKLLYIHLQGIHSLQLLKRLIQGSAVVEYTPIAKMFITLDKDAKRKLNRKFETAYSLCKQNLSFTKIESTVSTCM